MPLAGISVVLRGFRFKRLFKIILFAFFLMLFLSSASNYFLAVYGLTKSNPEYLKHLLYLEGYAESNQPPFPKDNSTTHERERLGRKLIYFPRLSGSSWILSATYHSPEYSWGDGLPKATGHGMKVLGRRTSSILSLA